MEINKIRELALANGFSLKEQASGNMDLHSYVYEFANALLKEATPEGFVFVPTEITQAMVDSLHYGGYAWGDKEGTREYFQDVYRRMIEAREPIRE